MTFGSLAAADDGGVETLAVLQAVDDDALSAIVGEPLQDRRWSRGRIASSQLRALCAAPREPSRARAACPGSHPRLGVARLHEDSEVAGDQVRHRPRERPSPLRAHPPLRSRRRRTSRPDSGRGRARPAGAGRPRPPSCRTYRSRTADRRHGDGTLSAMGTVSRCPAMTTRSGRPNSVRPTTALPSRVTSR